jgi:hypothetical protein
MCRRGSLSAAGVGGASGQGAPVELTSPDRYILGAHYRGFAYVMREAAKAFWF